jgi:hypothetical protein
MHELTTNLEPGNPDGHTVLRYLVEAKQMPLDVAIERVYRTHLRSQDRAASRLSNSLTKQRLILVVA